MSGVVVIAVGAALPILSSFDYAAKDVLVSLAGVTVALVTALRAFYRWDQSWVLCRQTEIQASREYFSWKGSPAAGTGDGQVRRDAAVSLLTRMLEIRDEEARSYFRELPWPQSSG